MFMKTNISIIKVVNWILTQILPKVERSLPISIQLQMTLSWQHSGWPCTNFWRVHTNKSVIVCFIWITFFPKKVHCQFALGYCIIKYSYLKCWKVSVPSLAIWSSSITVISIWKGDTEIKQESRSYPWLESSFKLCTNLAPPFYKTSVLFAVELSSWKKHREVGCIELNYLLWTYLLHLLKYNKCLNETQF